MEIVIIVALGLLFGGSKKKKASKLPGYDDADDDSKLPTKPTAKMPNWLGTAGVRKWQVVRQSNRWWWSVEGITSGFAGTPIAAMRAAIAAAISSDGAADNFVAIPRPRSAGFLEGAVIYDGAWNWTVGELAKGFPDLLKLNHAAAIAALKNMPAAAAAAGGEKDTRDEAVDEMISWLGATAKGDPYG